MPRRFAVGDAEPEYPDTPYDYFKPIYYEALDRIINCIKSRFNQPGYKLYCQLQQLLFRSAKGDDYQNELQFVRSFYGADVSDQLECQLQTFTHLCHEKPITLQTTALYAHVLQQYCEHFTTSFLIKLNLIAYSSHYTVHVKE